MNNCVDIYSSVTVMNSLNVCMYPIECVSYYYKIVCMMIMLAFSYHRIYAITYTPEIQIYICMIIGKFILNMLFIQVYPFMY